MMLPRGVTGFAALFRTLGAAGNEAVQFASAFVRYGPDHGLNRPLRVAHALGQWAHESDGFSRLEENLRYSAKRLRQVWPSRFPSDAAASRFANKPRALAERVYGGRLGNGPEGSGDGWRYRGRGLIQLTGRANYRNAGAALGRPYEDDPDLVARPEDAVLTACWFWSSKGLNALADRDDVDAITRRINGGTHGAAERQKMVAKAKSFMATLARLV